MNRIFNTAGPCYAADHYMIDAVRRLGDEVYALIARKQFFVIHAARQSGKTTLLKELNRRINTEDKYYALYCSLENAYGISEAEAGIPAVFNTIHMALLNYGLPNVMSFKTSADMSDYANALQIALSAYCRALDKPLILFFDEADCLSGSTLISFLRQLRNGYVNRPDIPFVHSLALVGMRNIRDYRNEYRQPSETLGSTSPFNIASKAMTLRNFTRDEITELYAQHTDDTGQNFENKAIDLIWQQTQGQPWLVNAVACEIIENITVQNEPITAEMAASAIQTLILRRDTHFDSLMARLKEDRVRKVIEPLITGEYAAIEHLSDDYSYVKDMGLIRDDNGKTEPANPIYAEVIVRTLNWDTQKAILENEDYRLPRFIKDGVLNMDFLLRDFQNFWRGNADIWQKKYDYQEAAPHLILQAFLQRIINGGGSILREMAAGTGSADLCVVYRDCKYPLELKIRYGDKTRGEGLKQLASYMDRFGCDTGWLILFDRRKTIEWSEKIFVEQEIINGKTLNVIGC